MSSAAHGVSIKFCDIHGSATVDSSLCSTRVLVNSWNIGVHAAFQSNHTPVVLTKTLAVLG